MLRVSELVPSKRVGKDVVDRHWVDDWEISGSQKYGVFKARPMYVSSGRLCTEK